MGWIGGTSPHNIRLQRVPGYQGFQPGIYAENIHGKTFAKVSQKSVQKKIVMGKEYVQRLNSQENLNTYLNGTLENTRNLALEKYQS